MLLERRAIFDERGFFIESFNLRSFRLQVGYDVVFVQANHSRSRAGVLRGLHYQLPPAAQGKLVTVIRGAIFDVAVDIRRSSPSFGSWVGYELSDENHRQLWIPPGYAHGFLVLSEEADLIYKTTDYYSPELERSIRWDDDELAIQWPLNGGDPILSDKDASSPSLADADLFD